MKKKLIVWVGLFVAALLIILGRMEISRFASDDTALLTAGFLLALFSGAGFLLELHGSRN